jgi:PPOX class probable F420-dependent enzyme
VDREERRRLTDTERTISERAPLTPEARAFVDEQRVGRLATVDPDGAPHVVPICYALLDDGCLYMAVDEKPKRTERLQRLGNIEGDARFALVIDRYDDDWSRLAWVMVRGRGAVLESGGAHAAAIEALRGRYEQYRSMDLDGRPLLRLTPDRVNTWGLK